MTEPALPGHEQLEFEAFKAVSGADYVRQRLLHGLSMGTPSIEDEAYAIKSRVKKVDSLVTKVNERRKDDKEYRPSSARDIVGLRLLTLFRKDLPLLVRRFLNFVEWSQKSPFSLFYGNSLKDAITEIKIYPTAYMGDPTIELAISEFQVAGFSTERRDELDVKIEVLPKESNYSSIHIVLWANGLSHRIPVEVQLRTSMEDVWGEIDHIMRYKSRAAGKRNVEDSDIISDDPIVKAQLKLLKNSLDNCSDAADIIGMRLNEIGSYLEPILGYSKLVSYDIEKIKDLEFRPKIKSKLNSCIDTLHSAYRGIYEMTEVPTPDRLKSFLKTFETSSESLSNIIGEYDENPFSDVTRHKEAKYRLEMELALTWYWRGILLRALNAEEPSVGHEKDVQHASKKAINIYNNIGSTVAPINDASLSFRLGNCIALRGEFEYAHFKFKDAFLSLPHDINIPDGHHLRVAIPRRYALSLWEEAERSKYKSIEYGGVNLFDETRKEQYYEALNVTLDLYGKEVTEGSLDRNTLSTEEENRISANNVIAYALCFLRAGGSREEIEAVNLSKERFLDFRSELIAPGLDNISRLTMTDTLRESARRLGDRHGAVAAARRALALEGTKDFNIALPEQSYREMLAEARRELDVGLLPFPGVNPIW